MSINDIKSRLSPSAKDIKLNLSSVLTEEGAPGLSQAQIDATLLASAYATQSQVLIEAVTDEVGDRLPPEAIAASQSAVALMAMNNVYYRSLHMTGDKDYMTMPAKLRMNAMANPGVEKVDFEIMSLAVSAINGCEFCIKAHVGSIRNENVSKEGVQSTIRIAAVVAATAQSLTF